MDMPKTRMEKCRLFMTYLSALIADVNIMQMENQDGRIAQTVAQEWMVSDEKNSNSRHVDCKPNRSCSL